MFGGEEGCSLQTSSDSTSLVSLIQLVIPSGCEHEMYAGVDLH